MIMTLMTLIKLDVQAVQYLWICAWPCLSKRVLSHNKMTKLGLMLGQALVLELLCVDNKPMSVEDVLQVYAGVKGQCALLSSVKRWWARCEDHVAAQALDRHNYSFLDIY